MLRLKRNGVLVFAKLHRDALDKSDTVISSREKTALRFFRMNLFHQLTPVILVHWDKEPFLQVLTYEIAKIQRTISTSPPTIVNPFDLKFKEETASQR